MALPAADPGRLHEEGRIVRDALEEARQQVAALICVTPREVVFTSGGTEAINAAVWGATQHRPGAPVLFADVEHSAVRDASVRLAPSEIIPVDASARIDSKALEARLGASDQPLPALVHCQWANHEVGTLQPVYEIVRICRSADVPVHIDAAAACGHVPMDLGGLGADLVAPQCPQNGGCAGRRRPRHSSGEPVRAPDRGWSAGASPRAGARGIAGPACLRSDASALGVDGQRVLYAEARRARRQIAALAVGATSVPEVTIVGSPQPEERLPALICLGVQRWAEPVLIGLDRAGVAVHSGSACSSESIDPSPVLEAMGVDASHSLRVSVGWSTTDEDVAAFCAAFFEVVAGLRALRG